mgnify:CR=1 FL=1
METCSTTHLEVGQVGRAVGPHVLDSVGRVELEPDEHITLPPVRVVLIDIEPLRDALWPVHRFDRRRKARGLHTVLVGVILKLKPPAVVALGARLGNVLSVRRRRVDEDQKRRREEANTCRDSRCGHEMLLLYSGMRHSETRQQNPFVAFNCLLLL